MKSQLEDYQKDKKDYEDKQHEREDKDRNKMAERIDHMSEDEFDEYIKHSEEIDSSKERDYSDEELKEIWDSDAGYVDGDAYGVDERGKHLAFYDSGDEKTPDELDGFEKEAKDTKFEEETILKRFGGEKGKFLTSVNEDFEKLSMNVSEDKKGEPHYFVVTEKGEEQFKEGKAASKFGLKGGGDQIVGKDRQSIEKLKESGYLRDAKPEEIEKIKEKEMNNEGERARENDKSEETEQWKENRHRSW